MGSCHFGLTSYSFSQRRKNDALLLLPHLPFFPTRWFCNRIDGLCWPARSARPSRPSGIFEWWSAIDLSIFNGSANAANIAVHILNEAGTNLAGHNIPGTNPVAQYPGQTGNNTVALAAQNTLHVEFQVAQAQIDPPNIGTSVHVTSDKPIAVGINIQWGGEFPGSCMQLSK